MTHDEIMDQLRRIYVERARDWDRDYDAFQANLDRRVGCLASELTRFAGELKMTRPTGDVHYYSFELPILAPVERSRITLDDVAEGEALYVVVYCATILPLTEIRWYSVSLGDNGKLSRRNVDVLDEEWLKNHPGEADNALKIVDAVEKCGWQVIGPDLTEQPAPKDWPWPLPSWDYQDGEYLVRDYIIKGMKDYSPA